MNADAPPIRREDGAGMIPVFLDCLLEHMYERVIFLSLGPLHNDALINPLFRVT